jgi:hypothetical protein
MSHDSSITLLGSTESSDRLVTIEKGDPAVVKPGLACFLDDANGASLTASDGSIMGICLGKYPLDAAKVSVCRVGQKVPLKVANKASIKKGDITFTAKANGIIGDDISIEALDTNESAACVVTVVGNKISLSIESGVTTAATIAAAILASAPASALITSAVDSGDGAVAQNAFVEDNLDYTAIAILGNLVYVSSTTGEAVGSGVAGAVATAAIYASGDKTGYDPIENANYLCALVDMVGGL